MGRAFSRLLILCLGAFLIPACGGGGGGGGGVLPSWARTYGWPGGGETAGGNLLVSGGAYWVPASTPSVGAGQSDGWLLKLDADGIPVWEKTYGGTGSDLLRLAVAPTGGGVVVAGRTNSFGAGGLDVWALHLDTDGNVLWEKAYGGGSNEALNGLCTTADGGTAFVGNTQSFGAGGNDVWIVKLNADGTIAWQETLGGTNEDTALEIFELSGGGYLVSGTSRSFTPAFDDFWILRLDATGGVLWQFRFGGATVTAIATSGMETSDGGFIVAGITRPNTSSDSDAWVIKLFSGGAVDWQRTYGGAAPDSVWSIREIASGGYVLSGTTQSFGGGSDDVWALRLDASGNVSWQMAFGGVVIDTGAHLAPAIGGGFVLKADTGSFGSGSSDLWMLRLRPDGMVPPLGIVTTAVTATPAYAQVATAIVPATTAAVPIDTIATVLNTATNVIQQAP